jgi:hypothetical protein
VYYLAIKKYCPPHYSAAAVQRTHFYMTMPVQFLRPLLSGLVVYDFDFLSSRISLLLLVASGEKARRTHQMPRSARLIGQRL